jgi:DegV family protein with EDD domain
MQSSPYRSSQQRTAAQSGRLAKVRVVADSATDILPNHARALGIIVVPNRVIMDDQVLLDGVDITPSQFFARLPGAKHVHTEPAPAEDFYQAYQLAFHMGASHILSIHISSRISNVIRNAEEAQRYFAPDHIHVIDSLQAGIGVWPAIINAAKLASAGAPLEEVRDATLAVLARTRMYFLVESLEYLRRSGRIGRAQELIGTLVNARPILSIQDGTVTPVETVRPYSRALLRLRDHVLSNGPIETLLISGSGIEPMTALERVLAERYDGLMQKTWLGPALAANTGPVLAAAVVTR